ncbi:unnamed protein product [Pleuronectes platessa]|uniref:Parathyroid hormone-related protein n=1 Tax=Pleuronectes platessa TaxID=8262 RepID=A0A9N7Z825_PLEPL|nr:unnamed protein product [Pleuronectes platessa]
MFCSRRLLQQWCFALFLLCSPVPHFGRPLDALSSRIKRSVTHAQLMHDKGRALQDFKRRMWLQELLDEVHTAEVRDLPVRTTGAAGGQQRGRRGAAGRQPGPRPQHHRKHPALQTRRRNQEPCGGLRPGGRGGNQPAAGNQQVAHVQVSGQEEEERTSREEEGGREEEEEGALVRPERGGMEVSARPAGGAALKRCHTDEETRVGVDS